MVDKNLFINPSVCIPIYKSDFNEFEIISIKSHIFKLKAHDIFLLVPKSKKNKIILSLRKNNIPDILYRIHEVKDYVLERYEHYNYLLLSPSFYQFYKSYSHILIAQIDAYTFSDRLIDWCRCELDYLGAPCYEFDKYWTNNLIFCGVGGFSLRSIDNTLKVLKQNPIIFKFHDLKRYLEKSNLKGKVVLCFKYMITKILRKDRLKRDIKIHRHTSIFQKFFIFLNEDISYGYYLPKYQNHFKVGDFEKSSNFCIDWNVNYLLKNISAPEPFGAHAWFTYPENLEEWKKVIKEIK